MVPAGRVRLSTVTRFLRSRAFDYWPVFACLVIGAIASVAVWQYELRSQHELGEIAFERKSELVREDLLDTMRAYGLFLRGGVGLFRSSDEVTRASWRRYVGDLDLTANYPGIQGVSFNAVFKTREEAEAFARDVRATDWADYELKPDGERDLYTPVLYLEPLSSKNERALGFDIYSEENRRTATDRAISTGEPAVTAKIRLVQEGPDAEAAQAGILVILPVYDTSATLSSASGRRDAARGLIVSVFRMGDLMQSILDKPSLDADGLVTVSLYDSARPATDAVMFDNAANAGDALFETSRTFDVFGRDWTFNAYSTPAFEASVASNGPRLVLAIGLLVTLLLTALALAQAVRSRERALAAENLAKTQAHIQFLLGEVNHRSKNLLGLVQAIARQTSASDPGAFMTNFSKRLHALSANQDLLVKHSWKGVLLGDLVRSQLAHFGDLVDTRILIDGEDVAIGSGAAETLGMAVHELATNAEKYGALSNDSGTVDISWKIVSDGEEERLRISWLETGGPTVSRPERTGFGSKVVSAVVRMRLNADVELRYEPSGFAWNVDCPLSAAIETDTPAKQEA